MDVLCFFKVLLAESILEVLFIPPKFARSVSHLTDKETFLEDSSGRRWRVTLCKHNGSLAIKQGWPKFGSEHGLKVGNFLVFRYVPASQHFVVQIFGTSGCEIINFCSKIGKGKKIPRTYPEATTPLLQVTSGASESEKVTYSGKGKSAMIHRDAPNDQEDGRLCLHQSTFEMPASKPLPQGTSSRHNGKGTKRVSTYPEAIRTSLLGPKDKKSKEASQFAREARRDKKKFEETTTEAFCPARAISSSGEEYANSEPADSGDAPSHNAVSYSCLVVVNGRDFLDLPESWLHLLKSPKQGRWIIFLRGPDKRIWPAFYHTRSGFNDVLICGWKQVTATYGLNAGDVCLFQLVKSAGTYI